MLIETLEGRRLFSVTVTEGYPGFYEVTGDEADDVIDITVSQNEATFTLDGQTFYDVAYLLVTGGDGNDDIRVLSIDGAGSFSAAIDAGEGDDNVELNFDGAIWGGAGNDLLRLSDAYSGEIYGGDGSDEMYLSGGCADAFVSGGNGGDLIDATANQAGAILQGDNGADEIRGTNFDDQIDGGCGNDVLYGNDGNDVFAVRDGEHDDINGGAGEDVAYSDANDDGMIDVEWVIVG